MTIKMIQRMLTDVRLPSPVAIEGETDDGGDRLLVGAHER
jgi:hypothetical protein